MREKRMAYRIRRAVAADEDVINELYGEMQKAVYGAEKTEAYEPGYLSRFMNGGESCIFIAETEQALGYLSAEVYRKPQEYMYLDDFAVREAVRGQGIGSALLVCAETYARKLNMPAVLLHVLKTNTRAFAFYKRHGYTVFGEESHRYLMRKLMQQSEKGYRVDYNRNACRKGDQI